MPATTSMIRPLAGPGMFTNTSSIAYQASAKTIIIRAGRIARPGEADRDRADQRAGGKARDQRAEPGLVDVVDVLGDIRQQPAGHRKRGQVDQKRQPHRGQRARRVPDIGEPLDEVAPQRRPHRAERREPDAAAWRPRASAEIRCSKSRRSTSIDRPHAERREQPRAGQRAGDPRRIGGRARHPHRRHQRGRPGSSRRPARCAPPGPTGESAPTKW